LRAGDYWKEGVVKKVTKALVILEDGTRISKKTHRDQHGWTWYPPTPTVLRKVKEFEVRASSKRFEVAIARAQAAVVELQEVASKATGSELRQLASLVEQLTGQLESLVSKESV
jgi:hypothetical protein